MKRPAKRLRHDQVFYFGPAAMPGSRNTSVSGPGSGAVSLHVSKSGSSGRVLMLEDYCQHWEGAWQDTRCLQTLSGHKDCVNAVAVLDADRIVSGSLDKTLKVWSVTDPRHHMAALQINRHWRDAISNPERTLCRKWLARQCE